MSGRDAFHLAFYHFIVGLLKAFLHIGARVRVVPLGKIPDGACVMVSNHISHFDPPLLSGWLPRKIDWIAMAELFSTKWSKVGFTWLDVIPVDRRGDDRQALRIAIKRLANERMIGIFPEGGIRDGERSILAGAQMREGAFLIASKAGCPVVPVVILGSERLYNRRNWLPWRRSKVYIAIGAPMDSRGKDRKTIRDETAIALIRLKDRLVDSYQLSKNDLPHSPQQRMREP
jgi:1-acyl-sn-glycerol-3-phosphate acyltransferase